MYSLLRKFVYSNQAQSSYVDYKLSEGITVFQIYRFELSVVPMYC